MVLFGNYIRTTIVGTVSKNDTTFDVSSVDTFPSISNGDYFYLVLVRLSDGAMEIVKVTQITITNSKTLTVTRAQEGSLALDFTSGDRAELWLTAGALNDLRTEFKAASSVTSAMIASGAISTDKVSAGAITAALLASTLDLSGKTLTMPTNRMPKIIAEESLASTAPDYVGQLALTTDTSIARVLVGFSTYRGHWVPWNYVTGSITETPSYYGQMAVCGYIVYIAMGTMSSEDWRPINTACAMFEVQTDDIVPNAATKATVFVKESSGTLQLFFKRASGDAVNITNPSYASGSMLPFSGPDWDSCWTLVSNNATYDLSDTGSGGFSCATKADSATGVTNASAALDTIFNPYNPDTNGFRSVQIMIRRPNSGLTQFNDVLIFPGSFGYTESYDVGAWMFWQGSGVGTKLKLKTGVTGIHWPNNMGLDWGAIGHMTSALIRIKIWK